MLNRALTPKLTADGLAFLKCATSSPDFSVDPGKGIPDKFSGRVINIKDCSTVALSFTPNTDTYIVVAPVPGIAYFSSEVAIGAQPSAFTAVPFPTYTSNFGSAVGPGTAGDNRDIRPSIINYNKFRYAAHAAGIYPTSNMMQYGGSVSVWKADISLGESSAGAIQTIEVIPPNNVVADLTTHHLVGTSSINPLVPRDNYTESFIKGSYTSSFDNSADFEWSDFLYDPSYTSMTTTLVAGVQTPIATFNAPVIGGLTQFLTGWGNCETIVHKVTTGTGAVNTANLKVWNCIEMQVNTNSSVYQFSHPSPHYDAAALEIYAKIRNELPVAVPCARNTDFWQRVLALVRGVMRGASHVPGPVGMISQGISALI